MCLTSLIRGHFSDQFALFYRFGGSAFPPIVLFKVFIGMRGQGVKYINGKKMIKPSTEVSPALVRVGLV